MKILEANAGALTNFEVLDFLRAKGASKDPTRVIAKVAQSEYKVYDYLVNTAACDQSRENISEFLESVKQHDLAKAEVLNILNIRPAAAVEIFPVYDYLVNTAACDQSRENISEFLESVKQHDLAKAEVLNILNIRPAAAVEIFRIIENCDDRFPDEEVAEIVELVNKTLPLPPVKVKAEEITKGNEETATLKHEKGNDISRVQNEGGEQMDTS